MNAPISVAPEEARKDYIATCFKMSHAQLFQELMRVHQAAGQLMDEQIKRAVDQERFVTVACYYELLKFVGDPRWENTSTGITLANTAKHLGLDNPYEWEPENEGGDDGIPS